MPNELTFIYEINQDGSATILGADGPGIGEIRTLEVPASLMVGCKEVAVTEVAFGSDARDAMRKLKKVVLPHGLLAIGINCFAGMGIERVNFPSTLKHIGETAFQGCRHLREALLPDGLESVGIYAFRKVGNSQCRTNISIPASAVMGYNAFCKGWLGRATIDCRVISSNAFEGVMFTSLALGPHVRKIMGSAFSDSNALHILGRIPDGVVYIGRQAFAGSCTNSDGSDTITLPDNLAVGEELFQYCHALRRINTGENTWRALMQQAATFTNSAIEEVLIPDGTSKLGHSVCSNCENLKSIEIPASVTTVCECAFENSGLERLEIPDTLVEIGSKAFCSLSACRSLIASPEMWEKMLKSNVLSGIGLAHIDVPEGVEQIGEYALANCRSLRSVSLPQSLQRIGESAFEDCRSLVEVDIPASVQSIGVDAFTGCYSLQRLILRSGPDMCTNPSACRASIDWYVPDECLGQAEEQKYYPERRVFPLSSLEPLTIPEVCVPEGKRQVHLKIYFIEGLMVLSHEVEPEHVHMLGNPENAGLLIYRYLLSDIANCRTAYLAPIGETYDVEVRNDVYKKEFDDVVGFRNAIPVAAPWADIEYALIQPFARSFSALCDFYVGENEAFDIEQLHFGSYKLGKCAFIDVRRICYNGEWHDCKIFFDEDDDGMCNAATEDDLTEKTILNAKTVHFYSHSGIVEMIIPKSFALESILIKN